MKYPFLINDEFKKRFKPFTNNIMQVIIFTSKNRRKHLCWKYHIDDLVQDCSNSIASVSHQTTDIILESVSSAVMIDWLI